MRKLTTRQGVLSATGGGVGGVAVPETGGPRGQFRGRHSPHPPSPLLPLTRNRHRCSAKRSQAFRCGREDLNLHALSKGTSSSGWRVYHSTTSAYCQHNTTVLHSGQAPCR